MTGIVTLTFAPRTKQVSRSETPKLVLVAERAGS